MPWLPVTAHPDPQLDRSGRDPVSRFMAVTDGQQLATARFHFESGDWTWRGHHRFQVRWWARMPT